MKIIKLKLKNFQLFKELKLSLDNINIITGINLDDLSYSGNGAGKSTIINAIIFALYGDISGLTLKELIKIGTKECSVSLECLLNNEHYKIIREIPTSLRIYKDKEELKFSTNTLTQKYLDNLLEADINKFRMYRVIDNNKGINLLDLGTLSLRKHLMEFVDTYFAKIRTNLLTAKAEKERFSIDKRLYTFHLSKKRLQILEEGLKKLIEEYSNTEKDYNAQRQIINTYKLDIQSREKIIAWKHQETKKLNNGKCPILGNDCSIIKNKQIEIEQAQATEIANINQELNEIVNLLQSEEEALEYYTDILNKINRKALSTRQYIDKLKAAFKFADYKYTKADIQLYADAIKTLDSFASHYVQEWLSNLSLIINDLLKNINISVGFSVDKNFIKVLNNNQELSYAQLSSGQKTFLNSIFKIGILLNEGISEGLLLIDEGLGNLDKINLAKLLEILKGLNFQTFIIYQNIDKSVQDVKFIELERKDGESRLLGA